MAAATHSTFVMPETGEALRATSKNIFDVDMRFVRSNVGQSRMKGVLSNLGAVGGWKAYPDDKGKSSDKSVLTELLSGNDERVAACIALLDEHEPDIRELADSLVRHGQIENIVIRPCYNDSGEEVKNQYNVSAGARRGIAICFAHALNSEVEPVLTAEVRDKVNSKEALKSELMMALEENRQRKNQSPIDDALFYRHLKRDFGMKVKEIAVAIFGQEEKYQTVHQRIQLLNLQPDEIERVHSGKLGVVNALKLLKQRADGDEKATAKDTPGVGERAKVPSVAQAKQLVQAISLDDLKEDTAERFGSGRLWELMQMEPVREYMSLCAGVDYKPLDELKREREEAAKAEAALDEATASKLGKKGKKKKDAEVVEDDE